MDIERIIQNVILFVQENVIVSVVIGITIIFLLFRHPKVLLTIIIFLVAAYGVAWIFEMLSKTALG